VVAVGSAEEGFEGGLLAAGDDGEDFIAGVEDGFAADGEDFVFADDSGEGAVGGELEVFDHFTDGVGLGIDFFFYESDFAFAEFDEGHHVAERHFFGDELGHHVGLVDGDIDVEFFIEEPGVTRVVDAGDGAGDVVAVAHDVAEDEVVGIDGGAGGEDLAFADAGEFEDVRAGGVSLVDGFGGEFLVDACEDVGAFLDEMDFVFLSDEVGGELGSGSAAAGDDDEHGGSLLVFFGFGVRGMAGRVFFGWFGQDFFDGLGAESDGADDLEAEGVVEGAFSGVVVTDDDIGDFEDDASDVSEDGVDGIGGGDGGEGLGVFDAGAEEDVLGEDVATHGETAEVLGEVAEGGGVLVDDGDFVTLAKEGVGDFGADPSASNDDDIH